MANSRRSPITIAVLGGNPMVANALALLVEGSGYDTKIIKESPPDLANGLLDGVDMLLLSPDLSNGGRDVLLSVVRGNLKTAAMPGLTLSTALTANIERPSGHGGALPSRLEDRPRAIEATLTPATSSDG